MSNTKHFTESLSAYLDGALNPIERAKVDGHLATCPQCRADLDELRYVMAMTRALPVVHAPRSFTLTPEMVAKKMRPWQFGWLYASLRGLTAVAAVLLVFVCSADFLGGSRLGGTGAAAPVPAVLSLPESTQASPAAADQATNQSKSRVTAAPAAPAGAAPAPTSAPAATAALAPSQIPRTPQPAQAVSGTASPTTRASDATTGTPFGTARSASAAATATAVSTVTTTAEPVASPSTPLSATNPVFPTVPLPVPPSTAEGAPQAPPFRPVEIGLLGALLVCGISAFVLRGTRR